MGSLPLCVDNIELTTQLRLSQKESSWSTFDPIYSLIASLIPFTSKHARRYLFQAHLREYAERKTFSEAPLCCWCSVKNVHVQFLIGIVKKLMNSYFVKNMEIWPMSWNCQAACQLMILFISPCWTSISMAEQTSPALYSRLSRCWLMIKFGSSTCPTKGWFGASLVSCCQHRCRLQALTRGILQGKQSAPDIVSVSPSKRKAGWKVCSKEYKVKFSKERAACHWVEPFEGNTEEPWGPVKIRLDKSDDICWFITCWGHESTKSDRSIALAVRRFSQNSEINWILILLFSILHF